MSNSLQSIADRLNAMSIRERVLIFVAVAVLLQQLWDSYLWLPMSSELETTGNAIQATESKLALLQGELKIFSKKMSEDPDKATRNALKSLEQRLAAVNDQTRDATSKLVTPAQMVQLLEQMIISEAGLELVSLSTMPEVPLIPIPEDDKKRQDLDRYQVYRHEFQIEFEGDYLSTLRYLEALENLPWHFFWDTVDYKVDQYPQSSITLKLYTLSLSKGFVGV